MSNWMESDGEWKEAEPYPFVEGIETTTWTFTDGSRLELEKNDQGYLLGGYIGEFAVQDEDYEDLHFPDTDSLIDFFKKHGLLKLLSKKGDGNG